MPVTQRLTAARGALLVLDMQAKLLDRMADRELLLANVVRLVHGAALLDVPTLATEQYPRGLGPTDPGLAPLLPERPAKTTFHGGDAPGVLDALRDRSIAHVTLVGIEAHVCVAQTALELLRLGYLVQVPADAVASRNRPDWEFALRRLEHAGAVVSTSEAVLFEWTESAAHPNFKAISQLVKDFPPPRGVEPVLSHTD